MFFSLNENIKPNDYRRLGGTPSRFVVIHRNKFKTAPDVDMRPRLLLLCLVAVWVRVFVFLLLFWEIKKTNDSLGVSITPYFFFFFEFWNELTEPLMPGCDFNCCYLLFSHVIYNGCRLTDRKDANSSSQMGDKNTWRIQKSNSIHWECARDPPRRSRPPPFPISTWMIFL